jgi:hypothetical protein
VRNVGAIVVAFCLLAATGARPERIRAHEQRTAHVDAHHAAVAMLARRVHAQPRASQAPFTLPAVAAAPDAPGARALVSIVTVRDLVAASRPVVRSRGPPVG